MAGPRTTRDARVSAARARSAGRGSAGLQGRTRRGAPTVGIVAPSGAVADPSMVDRAASWFAAHGWHVIAGDSAFARDTRFAGPDALRAAELNSFATDPALDLVLVARGGYGLTRLLPALDWEAIATRAPVICGYSDFTAFNLALLARSGGVSLQGPSAVDFGAESVDPFTAEHFWRALHEPVLVNEFDTDAPALDVAGRLWGGNLALVCALLGTPYFPRVRGGILFLEDVNESAYRVERMLVQLLQAGVLARQRAIVLGAFEPMPAHAADHGYGLDTALDWLRVHCATPVIAGLPFGHVPRKLALPVGARARLRVAAGRARLECRGHPTVPVRTTA